MADAAALGGRYDKTGVARATVATISEQFGLKPGYVELYPGSGGPLDMALLSNISPDRGLCMRRSELRTGASSGRSSAKAPRHVDGAAYKHIRPRCRGMVAADPKARRTAHRESQQPARAR